MRRTREDDLEPGMWVTVCGEKWKKRGGAFGGCPFRIIAISLPFIVVWEPKSQKHFRLDLSWYKVVKVSAEYVQASLMVAEKDDLSDEEVQLGGLPPPPENPPTSDDNSSTGLQTT